MPTRIPFNYTIELRPRRKTLCITISKETHVRILRPPHISEHRAKKFMLEKKSWIIKHLQKKQEHPVVTFSNGDKFYYLGKPYELKIVHSHTHTVHLDGDSLIMKCRDQNPDKIREQLIHWYKSVARDIIEDRVFMWAESLGKTVNNIRLKDTKTRWGSCSSKGNINMSWRLIMAPLDILDYVAVHECCHLVHQNHSSAFWAQVRQLMPDYVNKKKWLKDHGQPFFW